jgi:hypothetical protein
MVSLAGELSLIIEAERAPDGVARIQSLLNRLAGKLEIHKAMEEEALYSDLLSRDQKDIRELATDFQRRFGAVYSAFLSFRQRWDADWVTNDYDGFVRAARKLIGLLAERIEHENRDLYEVVDRLYGATHA